MTERTQHTSQSSVISDVVKAWLLERENKHNSSESCEETKMAEQQASFDKKDVQSLEPGDHDQSMQQEQQENTLSNPQALITSSNYTKALVNKATKWKVRSQALL